MPLCEVEDRFGEVCGNIAVKHLHYDERMKSPHRGSMIWMCGKHLKDWKFFLGLQSYGKSSEEIKEIDEL